MQDQIFRRLVRPVDPRSYKGIFSRGTPTYGFGGVSPNPQGKNQYSMDLLNAIKNRYMKK